MLIQKWKDDLIFVGAMSAGISGIILFVSHFGQ
jgi:hypothetical protein